MAGNVAAQQWFCGMATDANGVPSFTYGTLADAGVPAVFVISEQQQFPADPASNYQPDGTITLIVPKSGVGNPQPGSLLGGDAHDQLLLVLLHEFFRGGLLGDPCTAVNADMGEGGQGWYRYPAKGPSRIDYGQPGVVAAMTNLASDWNLKHPSHPIGIGDLSQFGGGFSKMHPKGGHRGGVIVDIRPMRTDGAMLPIDFPSSIYLENYIVQG